MYNANKVQIQPMRNKALKNGNIDFVVLYLDDTDPDWQRQFKQYSINLDEDINGKCRFREWSTFQFWLRSVEKYAPWVRKIHIVTCGHTPSWLDNNNPKINIVRHSDFMPLEALPTFNSNAIECNIHRIKGLAEQFVYFNDDMFLIQPTQPTDYFINGLPVYPYNEGISWPELKNGFLYRIDNCIGIINQQFNKREQIKKNFMKYFKFPYSTSSLWDLIYLIMPKWNAIYIPHNQHPMLKKAYEEAWAKEKNILEKTTYSKFRNNNSVNQFLFIYWQICKGEFTRTNKKKDEIYFSIQKQTIPKITETIEKQSYKSICLNDSPLCNESDFDYCRNAILESFGRLLPNKSSFEK